MDHNLYSIRKIRKYLDAATTKKMINYSLISWLDNCKSLIFSFYALENVCKIVFHFAQSLNCQQAERLMYIHIYDHCVDLARQRLKDIVIGKMQDNQEKSHLHIFSYPIHIPECNKYVANFPTPSWVDYNGKVMKFSLYDCILPLIKKSHIANVIPWLQCSGLWVHMFSVPLYTT